MLDELTSTDTFGLFLADHWTDSEVDARWNTSNIALAEIVRMRTGSKSRGNRLRQAGILQVLAITALTVATLLVVFNAPSTQGDGSGADKSSSKTTPVAVTSASPRPTAEGTKPPSCRPPLSTLLLC